ncbi:Arc family DNA-binding protein [Pectobacterium carotovorum]|uniref:Arc family DNA-binding protein n=1 Tax=Pectobacterium polaris TaxID=2042057 RepID=UPI001CF3BE45|nr:Arc family DNA-binding protein [Pectobacterium polaris]MCA6954648.1 ribbon-helix-helix domain-containing protein [Pectobacterium polaris]
MATETWQIKARLPAELRDPIRSLAKDLDRSVNYLLIKAVSEYIYRNSEAPKAATLEASGLSPSQQG